MAIAGRWRPAARWMARVAGAAVTFSALAGCSALQDAAHRGQRILETPGLRLGKVLAVVGAIPGAAVGLPFTAILVPTLPFEELTYPASPTHDIHMPVLFAPLDHGIGLGAFLLTSPLLLFNPDLGTIREPTEWPPDRMPVPQASPGMSTARSVEEFYPPPAPLNPPPIPPESPAPEPKSPVSGEVIPAAALPSPLAPPEGTSEPKSATPPPAVPSPPAPPEGPAVPKQTPPPPEAGPKG